MKVSIITASHKCRPWLKECILSVQNQKYPNFEHLILDDKSPDGSLKKLRAYEASYPNIKVFETDHRLHCGGAYNKLSKLATGDIVCVLDADDALCKNAIHKIVDLYKTNPEVGYVWTQFWYCDMFLKKIKQGFSKLPKTGVSLLDSGHCFSHWRTFRRSLLEQGEVFQDGLKSAVDKYMGYSLEEKGIGGFADVALYKYRQRPGGLSYTGKKNWRKMKVRFAESRQQNKTYIYPTKLIK